MACYASNSHNSHTLMLRDTTMYDLNVSCIHTIQWFSWTDRKIIDHDHLRQFSWATLVGKWLLWRFGSFGEGLLVRDIASNGFLASLWLNIFRGVSFLALCWRDGTREVISPLVDTTLKRRVPCVRTSHVMRVQNLKFYLPSRLPNSWLYLF